MKERGIPFTAPMVRALLAGTKTQTRRLLYVVTKNFGSACFDNRYPPPLLDLNHPQHGPDEGFTLSHWRHAKPGDRLWVREAWRAPAEFDKAKPSDLKAPHDGILGTPIIYEASRHEHTHFGKLRPGMFMPRWASRITLEVVSVRVERLQDISEVDAIAEGVERVGKRFKGYLPLHTGEHYDPATAGTSYSQLWESINGPGSWAENPWVWAISFQPLRTTQ